MGPGNFQHQLLLSALENCSSQLQMKKTRWRSVLMKKRASSYRRTRPRNAIERKVRTLRKLIPNCESMGVESLFRETADYIVALQMRVRLLQIMVDVLSGSDDDDNDE